ncbi:MAG: folate-binding protein [Cyanobacteriota bacterium]|nr:folate-binding protein [Cyanobacteriota bacterium]
MTAASASPWDWAPSGPQLWERPVSLLRLTGPDALRMLHGQTSQDLQAARPGDWRSTCCLTPTARLRGLAEVVVEEGGVWLALTAGDGAAQRQAFDRVLFPADQVELGPLLPGRWCRLVGQPPAHSGAWRPLAGGGGWWLGGDLLLIADTALPPELAALPRLEGREAERWRLRQGEPYWPQEINDAFNPFELGLADRVSLGKGCYVGQETLAKLASGDGVKQQLRRWRAMADPSLADPLPPGSELRTDDGTRAGRLTSSLGLDGCHWVGLAMVRRQALERTTLWATAGDGPVPVHLSRPEGFRDPPTPPPSGLGRRAGFP